MSACRRMWICLLLLIVSLFVKPGSASGAKIGSTSTKTTIIISTCIATDTVAGTTSSSRKGTAGPGPGTNTREDDDDFDYEEISVTFVVKDMGGIELPALIHNDTVYLPVSTLFNYLKIRNIPSEGLDSISGFFINQDFTYLIDRAHKLINYKNKTYHLQNQSLVRVADELYLRSDIYGQVFGLTCKFNFRNLAINMEPKVELPAVRELRQELMRQNIGKLKGNMVADTTVARTYPLFHFGMADWAVIATQRQPGNSDTRLNLSLGGILAGGEAIVSLNYNNFSQQYRTTISHDSDYIRPLDERQQFYRWRYANNDHAALRQVIAGKIYAQSVASIFAPVVGLTLTNTPTGIRRAYGTYTLSNFTEPNWTVELYVNGALVDYTKADPAGFFTFQVPLVYGNTQVTLRYYGPWGEERYKDENIIVPFNFLPYHEFEYSASGGMVQDTAHSQFAHIQANYGLTRQITVGGGFEYLSSVTTGKHMPFANVSMLVAKGLLFTADYTYNVRGRGILTYRHRSGLELEADYIRYKEGQQAINFNYLEEHRFIVSKPVTFKNMAAYTRLTLDHILLPGNINYTTAEWMISGAIKRVGTNLTTYGIFLGNTHKYIYSNLALTFRLPSNIVFMPQVQYSYTGNSLSYYRAELGKYLSSRGCINLTYEQNNESHVTNIGIGLRWDFRGAQTAVNAWHGGGVNTFVESARGSFIYDHPAKYANFNNRVNVGTGGVTLVPFLDLNNNGQRDKGEPKIEGVKISVQYGNVIYSKRDSVIMVTSLEPFVNYLVKIDPNSLPNIAWRIKEQTYSIAIDPNKLKMVEIPVYIVGEISGRVYLDKALQGRIVVIIRDKKGTMVARAITENDGTFDYIGLAPGEYTASIDQAQLKKIRKKATPGSLPFTIRPLRDGDVVEKLDFHIE